MVYRCEWGVPVESWFYARPKVIMLLLWHHKKFLWHTWTHSSRSSGLIVNDLRQNTMVRNRKRVRTEGRTEGAREKCFWCWRRQTRNMKWSKSENQVYFQLIYSLSCTDDLISSAITQSVPQTCRLDLIKLILNFVDIKISSKDKHWICKCGMFNLMWPETIHNMKVTLLNVMQVFIPLI